MRKIKEFLRLTHHGGFSDRQVALSLDISRSTVKDYRVRAQRAGLSWRGSTQGLPLELQVAGAGNGFTVELVRHRQTNETEQIGFTYEMPRQSSTLH